MKKWIFIALIASIGSVFAGTIATPHVAGSIQGWDASANPMTETSLGSDIWTVTFTNQTASTRYEFKITDGTWDTTVPGDNSWLYTDGSGNVTITYDGNSYSDGWLAATDRIGVSVDPGTWIAAGDFQSQVGGSNWDNANTNTLMTSMGGGIYSLTLSNLTAANYSWKAVDEGAWDSIGSDTRGFNTAVAQFTITEADLYVTLSVDAVNGVITTEVVSGLPVTPTNVTANAISSSKITVSWDAVSGAVGYGVNRDGSPVGTTASTSYTDSGLSSSSNYSYTVVATNTTGASVESASVNATTWDPPVVPAVPSNLVASAISHEQINLAWDSVSGATGYIVSRDSVQVGTSSTASYKDIGLDPLTSYSYTVAATNEAGTSADSVSAVAVTPYGSTVYSEANDGIIEYRDGWATPTNHLDNGSSEFATIGEWYGTNGLVCTVLPFQIPNLGSVTNPFDTASLQVFLERNDLLTNVDLYFLRSDTNSDIVASTDYYSGTNDTNSIMIEASFINPSSGDDVSLSTDTDGSLNLLDAINDAYDGGAGAGETMFLRLSYSSASWPTNSGDSADIRTREFWGSDDWPTLTLGSNLDSDNDGLPNAWEGLYGLDPNDGSTTNGATGDFDGDGVSNTNEYVNGTFPNDDDSDDDGLTDGDEVTEGTNPLDSDSDDDGLSDGAEVYTYITLPLDDDTDNDGYGDGLEVAYGTSPTENGENPGANGIVMDGELDSAVYSLIETQSVNTAWGDNVNELNAAYTCVTNGRLYLMLAGNIEDSGNTIELFFDTTDAVQSSVFNTVDWENGQNLDGLTFDTGFEPDYHCFFRRDIGAFNLVDLATEDDSGYHGLFTSEGSAITGNGGNANDYSMEVAYSNANTGGVVAGTNAATANHWTNSLYGLELSIDLRDLGNPSGQIKMMAIINSSDRNYLSNQALAGLPAPYGSLENPTNVNFSAISGDQFVTTDVGGVIVSGAFFISYISPVSGGVEIGLADLTVGASYKIQDAPSLTNIFSDVAGAGFVATSTNETVAVTATNSVRFFQAVSPQ